MTLDQVREMVEVRMEKERRRSKAGGAGSRPLSPRKAAPAAAHGGDPPVASPEKLASVPTPVALSEVGFPEVMPPRQNLDNQLVRIVNF
jgi:hypothetical protein